MYLTGNKKVSQGYVSSPDQRVPAAFGGSAAEPELDVMAFVWELSILLCVIAASDHSSGHRTPQLACRDRPLGSPLPPPPPHSLSLSLGGPHLKVPGHCCRGRCYVGAVVGSAPESANSLCIASQVLAHTHSREFACALIRTSCVQRRG